MDFIVCESVEELRQQSEGIDLIMINMECRKWCPDLFLFRILNEIKSITVMCYSTGGWVSQSILDEHRDRLLRLCYTEVIDSLRRCMASIQRGDALNTTWFMDVSNSLDGSPMVELECLSPRELDILCLVGKGHGTPEMAEILKCCPSTVETTVDAEGNHTLTGSGSTFAYDYRSRRYFRNVTGGSNPEITYHVFDGGLSVQEYEPASADLSVNPLAASGAGSNLQVEFI